jgi:hypothetical protein
VHQIVRGTLDTAEFEIFYRGQTINADGAVTVTIEDADNIGVILESGAATNDPALGMYTYELTPRVTKYNRVLKLTWSYVINTVSTYAETFYEVYTPYASVSDIIDYYDFGTRETDLNYKSADQIAAAENLARILIDTYAFQSFGKRTGSQEIVGIGGDAMELIERMTSITKLYEDNSLVIDFTTNPVYNVFGSQVELSPTKRAIRVRPDNASISYDNVVSPIILYYGRFRNKSRYRIEGELGFEYVPTDIQTCAILLAGDYLAQDAQWRNRYLKKVNMAELAFELHNGAFNGTGNLAVDTILDNYKNLGITVI